MDIVYTLKDTEVNEEFFYSLRTLVNLPHDRLFIVGGCPYNIRRDKVISIPTQTLKTKYLTTTNNLRIVAKLKELSDDFIWMNDDFFILQKIIDPVNELNLNRGTIASVIADYTKRCGRLSEYMTGAQLTMQYLQRLGVETPLSFELHVPIVYNKANLIKMFNLPGIEDIPVLHKRSIYGNLYNSGTFSVQDVKILNATQVDFQKFSSQKFLSSSDFTWLRIAAYLKTKFPDKCEYEM